MQKELAGGLVLRSLSEDHAADRDRLPGLIEQVFGEIGDPDAPQLAIWVRDLMNGHPTVTLNDIWVVVDPARDEQVVSTTVLIPQTWRYEDVELSVGRPELVATHKDYRRRGLVRALFEAAHQRSDALEHHLQGVTGIPHYYRQFGYTMAVELGPGAVLPLASASEPKKRQFTLRPAAEADIPDLIRWTAYFARQRLMVNVRSAKVWNYELHGRNPRSVGAVRHQVIIDQQGKGVGFVSVAPVITDGMAACFACIVGPEASYLDTFADVLYGIKQWASGHFEICPDWLAFSAGLHESLDLIAESMAGGRVRRWTYAWYLRVPDIARFIWQIAPVLERRLENSGGHRFTGTLVIDFYDKTGLRMAFEQGCITEVRHDAISDDEADAAFPAMIFLNLVFGYNTYADLRMVLPEVWMNQKAAVLLTALFPKKRSWIAPLD